MKMGLLENKSSTGLDSFVTGGMTGDVQRALILVAQIFTNKFDMTDNLRSNVVFPTTSLQAAWETNDVRKCHVEKHGNRTQQGICAGVCTKLRPMDGTAYKMSVVAKGTTNDNIDTHRKMRHTQRQGSRTIDLIRRLYGMVCRDQKIGRGGVFRYAASHHPGRCEKRRPTWLS